MAFLKSFKNWFYFIVGFVLATILLLLGFQGVESTASVKFCASCHEMKPLYETWLSGPHGPKSNARGAMRASCVDCHLPPSENLASYLKVKTISGTRDLFAHFFKNPEKIDWLGKLNEGKKYVFDRGCLKCHLELPELPAHQQYLEGKLENISCIDCHADVGHGTDIEGKLKAFWGIKEGG